MDRPAEIEFILFFSIMFAATLRVASPWDPFPSHFFLIEDPAERRVTRLRLTTALITLNLLPFSFFAVSLYLLEHAFEPGRGLPLVHYFVVPWVAMAVPGFLQVFKGLIVLGGTKHFGKAYIAKVAPFIPHPSPKAFLLPGVSYILLGCVGLAIVLAV